MPALTLYRLRGGHADLAAYVNTDVVGQPVQRAEILGASVALWRKTTVPDRPPAWAKVVGGAFPTERFEKPGPHDSALIVVCVGVDGEVAYWAMAFGAAARHWLDVSAVDRTAHLVAALEVLRDPTSGVVSRLTRVVAVDITREAQRITREMPREAALASYEFDGDVQAFRGAKATVNDPTLGRTMTAGDSVHLTSIADFNMALAAIRELEHAVRAGRTRSAPIPGVREIADPALLSALNDSMVEAFRTSNPEVVLNLPDAVQDRPLAIDASGTARGIEDFKVDDLRSELTAAGKLATINVNELAELTLHDPGDIGVEPIRVWPYFSASLTVGGQLYLLEDERWYSTPAGWLATVNARVDGCPVIDSFPRYEHANENDYNTEALAPHLVPAVSLDKHLTRGPGFRRSGIEILDVLSIGTRSDEVAILRFIAVKRGLFSQNVSHLFTQVMTAVGSLQDATVREAFLCVVRASSAPPPLLTLTDDLLGPGRLYDTSRIEIVIAIVGDWRGRPVSASIPVLGRAGLQQTIARARALGHPVSIARISTVVDAAEKKTTRKAKKRKSTRKKAHRGT